MAVVRARNLGYTCRLRASWIILALAILAFGQTAAKKEAAPTAKKVTTAIVDTWERSKECAAQAEKLVAEWDREALPKGFAKTVWTNHYSPKYNRCFVQTFSAPANKPSAPMTSLLDAFERSTLAEWDPANENCHIDLERIDCAKAADFIKEHMRN